MYVCNFILLLLIIIRCLLLFWLCNIIYNVIYINILNVSHRYVYREVEAPRLLETFMAAFLFQGEEDGCFGSQGVHCWCSKCSRLSWLVDRFINCYSSFYFHRWDLQLCCYPSTNGDPQSDLSLRWSPVISLSWASQRLHGISEQFRCPQAVWRSAGLFAIALQPVTQLMTGAVFVVSRKWKTYIGQAWNLVSWWFQISFILPLKWDDSFQLTFIYI